MKRLADLRENCHFAISHETPEVEAREVEAARKTPEVEEGLIGHVPVLMIDNSYWQNGCMTQMPAFYHDPENRIVNIDLGCALIPRISANPDRFEEAFKKVPSLCVLNLDQFAKGEECPALYIRGWDFDTNNS